MKACPVIEKNGLQLPLALNAGPRTGKKPLLKSPLRRWTALAAAWGLSAAGLWVLANPIGRLRTAAQKETKDYRWADIAPSRVLQWHACYDGEFECARLDLPMDWVEPSDELRVHLAVIRLPAKTQEDYRGPVFVNPGVCISRYPSAVSALRLTDSGPWRFRRELLGWSRERDAGHCWRQSCAYHGVDASSSHSLSPLSNRPRT